jgi:hypothetical protein
MRDYWLTKDLLQATGIAFIVLSLIGIALALWLPKKWWGKLLAVAAVAFLISIPVRQGKQEVKQQEVKVDDFKVRYAKAKALFEKRCETAGEKIYKTVEGVEGVFILRPRTEELNYSDQFKLDDPYGYAGSGEDYLKLFVRGRTTVPAKTGEIIDPSKVVSYRFVEIFDETGKGFYRYTTTMSKEESERFTRNGGGVVPLGRTATQVRKAKYGITWADISTNEDRQSWIAGSSLKIIDLQTNDVIAERIGYMFDKGLGNTSGGRSPWSVARDNACPSLDEKTFYFFDRVIKPTGESSK